MLVEEADSVDWNRHERAPAIVLALVLEELQKRRGRSHRDVKANVVTRCSRRDEPTLLIGLEGQVPGLIEGACDVVKSRCYRYRLRGERQV